MASQIIFRSRFISTITTSNANDDVPVGDPCTPEKTLRGVYETGGEDVHADHDPTKPFDSYHFESVSFEAIYRLLSPYKDPIGLALYFEPSWRSGNGIGMEDPAAKELAGRPTGLVA